MVNLHCFTSFLILGSYFCYLSLAETYQANVWQNPDPTAIPSYPEQRDPLVSSKPNTAISFSGGGSRSYIATFGILAGLYELDLLKNVRYMGGISGGSWATMTYTFAQLDKMGNITDATLLGKVINPSNITYDNLNDMDKNCARSFTHDNFAEHFLYEWTLGRAKGFADAWVWATQVTYMDKAHIPRSHLSWSNEVVKDIISRNPKLKTTDFVLPSDRERPFPVIGSSFIGPADNAPYDSTRNTSLIDFTPMYVHLFKQIILLWNYIFSVVFIYSCICKHVLFLFRYIGQMNTLDIHHVKKGKDYIQRFGGLVEPFAFGGLAPNTTMDADANEAILTVPVPTAADHSSNQGIWGVADAAGASSYAPGLAESTFWNPISEELGLHADYWSPSASAAAPSSVGSYLADGGCLENVNLIAFLQRRVEKIILFGNFERPMAPLGAWDPIKDELSYKHIEITIPGFFGLIPKDTPSSYVKFIYDICLPPISVQ